MQRTKKEKYKKVLSELLYNQKLLQQMIWNLVVIIILAICLWSEKVFTICGSVCHLKMSLSSLPLSRRPKRDSMAKGNHEENGKLDFSNDIEKLLDV